MSVVNAKKMPYVRLGNSGLKVSKIILGTMQYGHEGWAPWSLGEEEGIAHIKAAYDVGIQSFDTANVYSNGLSEIILGKAIKKHNLPREEIVVMTKVYFTVAREHGKRLVGLSPDELDKQGYVNQRGLSRKNIFASVKASLERLQLDYIDLLQCHRFDYDTPIEETMQALHDVVQAGYVRYIGMSSCHAYQFHAMQSKLHYVSFLEVITDNEFSDYAIQNKLTPFISMQNHYSLIYREEEREMFPTLKMFGVGSIPWSPLAGGKVTRPISAQKETKRGDTDHFLENYSKYEGVVDRLVVSPSSLNNELIPHRIEEVANKRGVSMAQVSMAWVMSKPGVTAPIVGTTKMDNLKDIIGSLDVKLTEEEIKYLEEPYIPQAIVGHI
ncbi:Aldo keto reductase [Coniophora puteana RWD-64-598 SS2]|uniref:Aldo keto reductase n=1 Tax=Coniophora puteana (strain RWD-64-598) TaxID=741705 RepID=A0A5M3MX72_CONPW|nr:Aldo keto reductase [Coniophora puteana RWD-64-598 SS2]EIW83680.1 Aldo keto reductase [Coniophora puteana RWD-64-598 SS2]